mmetsp:Transcript_24108/g.65248  ORF Transcript_24108/g.65248 Transcript_24108/m.65248 type:complete len:311 (+) Transcript_24108:41-973(+)
MDDCAASAVPDSVEQYQPTLETQAPNGEVLAHDVDAPDGIPTAAPPSHKERVASSDDEVYQVPPERAVREATARASVETVAREASLSLSSSTYMGVDGAEPSSPGAVATKGMAGGAHPIHATAVDMEGAFDASCFICLDNSPPLYVGCICRCQSLAAHRHCLEDYINQTVRATRESIESRLTCPVCLSEYSLPYRTSAQGDARLYRFLRYFAKPILTFAWMLLGVGFGVICFFAPAANLGPHMSSSMLALIVMVCYFVFGFAAYVFAISRIDICASRQISKTKIALQDPRDGVRSSTSLEPPRGPGNPSW